jgi:hypothetical protein
MLRAASLALFVAISSAQCPCGWIHLNSLLIGFIPSYYTLVVNDILNAG